MKAIRQIGLLAFVLGLFMAIFARSTFGLEDEKSVERPVAVSVPGRVVDEEGKPLGGVSWWISAIEEWKDGHWIVVNRSGYTQKNVTDENGRFNLIFRENVRYDLQFFDKGGYGPTFLYQISKETPEINVVMKKGIPIRGTVSRLVNGIPEPVRGSAVVVLRLPNSRGTCYSKHVFVGYDGEFVLFASVPLQLPMELDISANGEPRPYRKWQVVFAGEIVQIEVEEGKQIDDIHFEVEVKVTRGKIQQPDRSDKK